jgi:elongation factor Ts
MAITMDQIKKLRLETGAGVMDAKKALEEAGGDLTKAKKIIQKKGLDRAEKKSRTGNRPGDHLRLRPSQR